MPVLDDQDYRIGQQLRVRTVPNVSIIDRGGILRLTNGASLSQVLGYEVDLTDAIRRAADRGSLMTYGYLDRYYPAKELEGKSCPDFTAPLLTTSVEKRWHSMLDDEKLNVLIFWSVDCPHCRKSLPQIDSWLRKHPGWVNVVSAATVDNEVMKNKTQEYCRLNGFVFPTLLDKDSRIRDKFQVTSTPTLVIVGPDGVIDSVVVSSYSDFGEMIEEKRRKLLETVGAS